MDIERNSKPVKGLNLIPMINIIFLLLIFFLMAGSVEKVSVIDVQLPLAASGNALEGGPVEILLGRHNEVIVNDKPVAMDALANWIATYMKDHPNQLVTIKADARLPASRIIDLFEVLKRGGATHISVTTQDAT